VNAVRTALKNRALIALMMGHFVNDMFAAVLPILYPIAKTRFGLSNADVGFLTLAYTTTGSLFQPVFGHLTDRWQNRWLAPLILSWSVVWVSLYGLANSYWMLFAFAALAGVGSGAYHPLGASGAARVSDPRLTNVSLSLYTVGGTSGYALGPVIAVTVLGLYGARGTMAFLIPGAIGVTLLASQMGQVMRAGGRRIVSGQAIARRAIEYRSLACIIGVVMLRSWSFLALIQFVPVWYDDMGFSRGLYGPLTTTVILAGVAGTLVGGTLADRFDGRRVIIVSQLLCVPAIIGFVQFPGAAAFVFGAIFGFSSDASLSMTLSAAQRLLPGRTGIASGVILGLGFITGGVGVPIIGAIADHASIKIALMSLSLLCLVAAVLAWRTAPRLYHDPGMLA
jgi:MFS transporter, FSR family, fosmidomycin resistance protein